MDHLRIGFRHRRLTKPEEQTAWVVFFNTIKYENVRISDGVGQDGRAFTFPVAPLTAGGIGSAFNFLISPINTIPTLDLTVIFINFGPEGYANALYDEHTFIHEMTHVWQYMHLVNVVQDSISQQSKYGNAAYHYPKPPTESWEFYNVEQQAEIVADWFMAQDSRPEWFKFIQNNIRAGRAR